MTAGVHNVSIIATAGVKTSVYPQYEGIGSWIILGSFHCYSLSILVLYVFHIASH